MMTEPARRERGVGSHPGASDGQAAEALLTVRDLHLDLPIDGQLKRVLHDVSLDILPGEAVGLVGESGSGKSLTARSIARLLPRGAVLDGEIRFDGTSVTDLRGAALRRHRARSVSMIFQDPRAHTNPVRSIGDFLTEALIKELGVPGAEARRRAVRTLGEVGIADGERRLHQYPHELSGGMLQRVMIASALLAEPRLILADEPTTALDVTTQSEVIAILDELRRERGLALLFITHDLELAAAVCDRSAVMYAGSIVELQTSDCLNTDPLHPYSAALMAARPSVEVTTRRLVAISGRPLSAFEAPSGCAFAGRCPHREQRCVDSAQTLRPFSAGLVRCCRAEELRGHLVDALEEARTSA
jgi:oligopeptide/dipeptide ABC transporter ATP-binding protein